MKYRGFTIEPWYEILTDCRPPRGREVGWQELKKKIKLFGGYKCSALWGDKCMGGNRFHNPLTIEQGEIALQEIKCVIDNVIERTMQSVQCSEKEAVKLLKES